MKIYLNKTPVLIYHSVGGFHKEMLGLNIFRRQMKLINQKGYKVIALDDLIVAIIEKKDSLRDSICLTFDDGYEDFFYNAFPLLEDYGFKMSCFLTVSKIGKEGYLKNKQIREMLGSRLLTIGSHGMSHKDLLSLQPKEQEYEINESKKILQDSLGVRVEYFAYPYGSFNLEIKDMVKKAGYQAAFATNQGRRGYHRCEDIFAIKRLSVLKIYNPLRFLAKTSGLAYYFAHRIAKRNGI